MKFLSVAMALAAVAVGETVVPTSFGYRIDGLGEFSNSLVVDFQQARAIPAEMYIPSYSVKNTTANTLTRTFSVDNVVLNSGDSLSLLLPGSPDNFTTQKYISVSGLYTKYNDVLYGTFRTVAKLSKGSGAINMFQMYSDDPEELNFSFLTNKPSQIQQLASAVNSSVKSATVTNSIPSDATDVYHEYRVDWSPKGTDFFIDGVKISTITSTNPSSPGSLVWSNWSNGNSARSGTPGSTTGDMRIQSITAYFNRTTVLAAREPNKPCGTQPITYTYKTPTTSGDALAAFLGDSVYSSAAASAPTPAGFKPIFRNMVASANSPRYLTVAWQSTYNVTACANICSGIPNCQAFNIFVERNPALNPAPACTNPSSITNVKCTFFDGPLNYTHAVNWGEWRQSFGVVIAGSNGYNVAS